MEKRRWNRIYKSMEFNDFMDMIAFVAAFTDVDVLSVIQEYNYLRKNYSCIKALTKEELESRFVKDVGRIMAQAGRDWEVSDNGRYYLIWYGPYDAAAT